MGHRSMLKYMEFVESSIINPYLFQRELSNCIDTPSAQEKVKSVLSTDTATLIFAFCDIPSPFITDLLNILIYLHVKR